MTNAIETVELTRRFGRVEAVERLNLHVPAGSIFALVGPNGAGKTTTIKLLMNLLRPTSGRASVLGIPAPHLTPHGFERIGYVAESQRLPDDLTPAGLLEYCRPFYPTWDAELSGTLQAHLQVPMHTRLRSLSRGTRMKAAVLAALSHRPELIVLDEPFSGLDPLVRDELVQALLELAGERSCTTFISSHDIEEVERLADRVGFIEGGHLVFAEEVSTLLSRFRLVEVIGGEGAPSPLAAGAAPAWIGQGVAGRTLRFIDTQHGPEAPAAIAAAYPGAEIAISPMSLREIFVALARRAARAAAPAVRTRRNAEPQEVRS